MEAQRGEVTRLSSHSISVAELGLSITVNPKLGLLYSPTPWSFLKKRWVPTMCQALNLVSRGHREEWDTVFGPDELVVQFWWPTDKREIRPQGEACRVLRAGTKGPGKRGGRTSLCPRSGQASDDPWPLSAMFFKIIWPWPYIGNIFYTNTLTHTRKKSFTR